MYQASAHGGIFPRIVLVRCGGCVFLVSCIGGLCVSLMYVELTVFVCGLFVVDLYESIL